LKLVVDFALPRASVYQTAETTAKLHKETTTMQYLILIYSNETADASATKEEMEAWMGEYWAYTEALQKAGVFVSGEALHPTSAATTVRVKDGKRLTTAGPFAETKEQLGGYYAVKVDNLDQAIDWAAKCPGARVGSIEVRPVMEYSQ
jgi:hypothetical protein